VPPFKIRRLTRFSLSIPAAMFINVGFPVGVLAAVELKGEGEGVGKAVLSSPVTSQNGVELILDRRQRLLRVMEGNQERRRFRVGVGMPGWETPVGSFSVIEKTADPVWEHPAKGVRIPPGPSNPLGSRWIGFHRDCKGRRGFNGQEHLEVKGCVSSGFHGTPQRDSVGAAVSHGCVRLFDEDVRELFEMVQLGTPVTVLP
jgi:L,D-transpeptidase ErfK/SrfK